MHDFSVLQQNFINTQMDSYQLSTYQNRCNRSKKKKDWGRYCHFRWNIFSRIRI